MTETPSPQSDEHLPEATANPVALKARVGCSALVLLLAVGIAVALYHFRTKPAAAIKQDPVLGVTLVAVSPTNTLVTLESYGEVRALRVTDLSPEISSRVIRTPRVWQEGDLVRKDEVLVELDDRDYRTAQVEARAQVAQAEAVLAQLKAQQAADRERATYVERSRDLARAEFERSRRLFEKEKIGSETTVENAESAYNQSENQRILLQQALSVYPARLEEAENNLQAAKARQERAELNLARCILTAPFNGRLTFADVETGRVVQPGTRLFTLSDDSTLEVRVPLDASDLRQWLPFREAETGDPAWFPPLQPQTVTLTWTEGKNDLDWTGSLDRVVAFDPTTRMVSVAVRISAEQARGAGHGVPLVPGMFCRVRIPGRELTDVYALPRRAVTFNNQVYLSVSNSLRTANVQVRRAEGDLLYIDQGLSTGDLVITTRLVAPLEGIRLEHLED